MDNGVLLNIGRPVKFNNKVPTTPTDAKIPSTPKTTSAERSKKSYNKRKLEYTPVSFHNI